MLSRKASKTFLSLLYKSTKNITQIANELQFTPKFYSALNEKLINQPLDTFLRLQIFAGEGCQGYTYKFKFDNALDQTNDLIKTLTFESQKYKDVKSRIGFAINKEDIRLLQGSTMDFAQEMMRSVFYVKENPNAEISCSCKVSFSPKEYLL